MRHFNKRVMVIDKGKVVSDTKENIDETSPIEYTDEDFSFQAEMNTETDKNSHISNTDEEVDYQ